MVITHWLDKVLILMSDQSLTVVRHNAQTLFLSCFHFKPELCQTLSDCVRGSCINCKKKTFHKPKRKQTSQKKKKMFCAQKNVYCHFCISCVEPGFILIFQWDPDSINEDTEFIMGVKANKWVGKSLPKERDIVLKLEAIS